MNVAHTSLPGVKLITLDAWRDERGSFRELWHQDRYADAELPQRWVQDNTSHSRRAVLRGLHFQSPRPQGKLVSVLHGAVLDVVVDVRLDSPHFGKAASFELSFANARQLYVPPGFAHGFVVIEEAVVHYKCTEFYSPQHERTLLWSDVSDQIDWPDASPVISPKDALGLRLDQFADDQLPRTVSP